jgi:UDP-N-acetylmuramoyl-L-alanyl-D-glutamate--2,6-diaminopimelate ligase
LLYGGQSSDVHLPAMGPHNVENALVAAGIGLASGLSFDDVAERLATVPALPGRMTHYCDPQVRTAVVDFAHNPDALERVLKTLKARFRRLAVVFGCPGGTARAKRLHMGEVAGRLAEITILTTDNPKHELPDEITQAIAEGVRRSDGAFEICLDREDAIRRAADWASGGDCILVAGKGHERVQIVGNEAVPYSDASVIESLGFVRSAAP